LSTLLIGAAMVAMTIPVLWWAFSGPRVGEAVARNLRAGLATSTNLRDALLAHSATDRVVGPAIARFAGLGRTLTPTGSVDRLERRILLAGAPAGWTVERVLAAKLILAAAPFAALGLRLLLSPSGTLLLLTSGGSALGWFAPSVLLLGRAQDRQAKIQRELPDTLDQVTLTVEAGLGFDAAVARAARAGDGPLAQELLRMLQDVQAGMSRADALRRLIDRTDVPELRRFVLAVLQADSYGVPIATVLRIQAGELRVKRRQLAEERAMKLPVKILFPLILCIFPVIFIVLLGPAAIRIADTLGNV